PLAPSAIAQLEHEPPPKAVDAATLAHIKREFVDAAGRALRIGVCALELHMAHGYLLHEFLSPLSNRRNDAYGGSFEKRIRFPLEAFSAVREFAPQDKALGVRISVTAWIHGAATIEDSSSFDTRLPAA